MTTTIDAAPLRVSTIELFFDLVFVFTITQLTQLVERAQGAMDLVRALLVLMLIWWIYAGYAWLTNAAAGRRGFRLVIVAAMAGFFVMAIALPERSTAGGVAFGVAYLGVVGLHIAGFYAIGDAAVRRGIVAVAPFNLTAAACALAAGIVTASWDWLLLAAGVGALLAAGAVRAERGFTIQPSHFVERHGLFMIVALGETIVAIGIGARDHAFDGVLVGSVILALAYIATFWWTYFDGDDERAEHVLRRLHGAERARAAATGFHYAHLLMLAGIVLVAAALGHIVAGHPLPATTWALAGGTALYLLGDAAYRWTLDIRPVAVRVGVAVAACASAALGLAVGAAVQLATLTVLLAAMLAIEQRRANQNSGGGGGSWTGNGSPSGLPENIIA